MTPTCRADIDALVRLLVRELRDASLREAASAIEAASDDDSLMLALDSLCDEIRPVERRIYLRFGGRFLFRAIEAWSHDEHEALRWADRAAIELNRYRPDANGLEQGHIGGHISCSNCA